MTKVYEVLWSRADDALSRDKELLEASDEEEAREAFDRRYRGYRNLISIYEVKWVKDRTDVTIMRIMNKDLMEKYGSGCMYVRFWTMLYNLPPGNACKLGGYVSQRALGLASDDRYRRFSLEQIESALEAIDRMIEEKYPDTPPWPDTRPRPAFFDPHYEFLNRHMKDLGGWRPKAFGEDESAKLFDNQEA